MIYEACGLHRLALNLIHVVMFVPHTSTQLGPMTER